jgi:hypothetical protein
VPKSGSHKSQHYIPRSYLSAWCDPHTPTGMQPFVWTFDPSGGVGRKRAPQNLFTETDIYTVFGPGGSRDLAIEFELSKLEQGLKKLVTDFVASHRQLPRLRQSQLIAFITAMHGRTPQARELQRTLWQQTLEATVKKAVAQGNPANSDAQLRSLRKAVASPMQFLLPGAMMDGLPMLSEMTMTIMCSEEPSFITSDSPVTWFDPTVPRQRFLTQRSTLADPGIEVVMPLSPRHTIILHHPRTPFEKPIRYVGATPATVAALNRRTAHYAHEAIVSWKDGFDPEWRIGGRVRLGWI